MQYGSLTQATEFYESSKQNIRQRGLKGSIPTIKTSAGKTAYLLHNDYKLTFSKKGKERNHFIEIPEKDFYPPEKVLTKEVVDEAQQDDEDEPIYKVAQPRESLFTNPELVEKALSTRMTITDSDRECIELFCEHYRDYLLYYRLATAEPIVKGFVNPYFKLSREQWAIIKELSAQLGIGIKNRLALKVEAPQEANPFEQFMS